MSMMQITTKPRIFDLDATETAIENAAEAICWLIHRRLNGSFAPYQTVDRAINEIIQKSNFPEPLEAVLTGAAVLQRFEFDYPGEWSKACAEWKANRERN